MVFDVLSEDDIEGKESRHGRHAAPGSFSAEKSAGTFRGSQMQDMRGKSDDTYERTAFKIYEQ